MEKPVDPKDINMLTVVKLKTKLKVDNPGKILIIMSS
jgi:hypothetical protein